MGHAGRDKKRDKMSASSDFETFGRWLKRRRKLLDLTQDQLGELAGCSGATIRKFEADERKPSRQLAGLLAQALQILDRDREAFLQLARGIHPATLPAQTPVAAGVPEKVLPADNLPAPLTSLVDRANDITAVSALLRDPAIRWVTLLGPPGIGKTRLSIQSGRQVLVDFTDGVWFVDLALLADPDLVLPALSRALVAFDLPPVPDFDQLATALKNRQALLILDNFEHVSDAALMIAELLKRSARLKLLATSRIPLHIYGEHEYRVPPLAIPPPEAVKNPPRLMNYEAVQLFVARTRQHMPAFAVSPETAAAVVSICSKLDGIPLALELAAATLQRMSLAELDGLLHKLEGGNWLRQVDAPARDLPARQRTLENVVAWSYTLLDSGQQALFCSLGVFSGWFDVDAAASICFDEPHPAQAEVRRLLYELSDHSLLERGYLGGVPCWRMLEIIHEYASLQLAAARRTELETLHAGYLLRRMQFLADEPDLESQANFFQIHTNNLHAALSWAIAAKQTELGFELAGYLGDFWTNQGYNKELLLLMVELFALPDAAPPEVRANRLQMASDLAWQQHDFETALLFAQGAVDLGRLYGLSGRYAAYVNRLGRINMERGNYIEARQALEECLALARADPRSMNPGAPLAQLGELAMFEGRLEEAKSTLLAALAELPDSESIFRAIATVDLAEIMLAKKNFTQARHWLLQASDLAHLPIRRALVYLCAVTGYLVAIPASGKEAAREAARFYGALEALGERSGVILSNFYSRLNQPRIQAARRRLPEQEWQAEFAAGQGWSRDFALEQAKRVLDHLKP